VEAPMVQPRPTVAREMATHRWSRWEARPRVEVDVSAPTRSDPEARPDIGIDADVTAAATVVEGVPEPQPLVEVKPRRRRVSRRARRKQDAASSIDDSAVGLPSSAGREVVVPEIVVSPERAGAAFRDGPPIDLVAEAAAGRHA